MNIELSEKTAEFLKELAYRMNTQDNRATAAPYYYVVRCTSERIAPEWSGDVLKYYFDGTVYTEKELEEYCTENELDLDETKAASMCGAVEEHDEYDNVFLTYEGYRQHMALNEHNYRHFKGHDSYVKHAFRNPEMASLFEAIKEIGMALEVTS